MKKMQYTAAAAMMMLMGLCATANAAFDENLNDYTLDTMVVEADAAKNKFGDTITEQSYYRTGGDVKVITREEIEKRHYTDLTEAIKRIPGVTFQNPGYRGGEYGYQFYNNGVSINGDTRVIILVDGRRVDNGASTRVGDNTKKGTKSTGVNLDQVTNMENVDKIEVIKGPGASVYGSDALGGVINIITRKGAADNKGSIDLATGSWDKHKYALSYSGSAGEDKSWHYFVSANRDMSGDTKYKDGSVGETGTLGGSNYKEDGVNIRVDKDFNDKQSLKVWYNFKQGRDGYPIATPNLKYWNEKDWKDIIFKAAVGQLDENNKLVGDRLSGDSRNPGYHNLYALDGAVYGSFSKFKNNDWDIQYTFDKDNGMESFVRVYDQNHRYAHRDKYRWGIDSNKMTDAYKEAFPNGATDAQLQEWIDKNLAPLICTLFTGQTGKEGIFMRYTYEYKINCVELYRQGKWPETPNGIKERNFRIMIGRWARIEKYQGPEALRHKNFNKIWTPEEKLELISQVLAGKSNQEVALSAGINGGMLYQWVQKYKSKGYNGLVDMKKGRPPKEPQMKKNVIPAPLTESEREELIRLRAENEYIKAENEVIKKRIALRQEKEAARLKAKKQRSSKNSVKKDIN